MERLVYYNEEDGYRNIGQLQEFIIDRFFDTPDPRTGNPRHYGFARLAGTPRGSKGIFFHIRKCFRWMTPYSATSKLKYYPAFSDMPNTSDPVRLEPRDGMIIVGVAGQGRKGLEILAWSFPSSYKEGLELCELYTKNDLEKLERDPRFRCLEIRRLAGSADIARMNPVFEGTKKDLEQRHPLGAYNYFDRPDPLLSQRCGDVEYIRWFERETADGWEKCEDPRKMKFQLTLAHAIEYLWVCTRQVREDKTVEWRLKRHDTAHMPGDELPLMAIGNLTDKGPIVQFVERQNNLNTTFEGNEARRLWTIGASTIPAVGIYEYLNG